MGDSTLYDDDILLWSEQQAAAIRRLRQLRGLPNALDIDNVAEEIESVGRSELAAVKSYLRLILLHLIKIAAEDGSAAAGHWRGEIAAFAAGVHDRYAPSMRQRIDMDELWSDACIQASLSAGEPQQRVFARLPGTSPVVLDGLLVGRIDIDGLVARVRASLAAL